MALNYWPRQFLENCRKLTMEGMKTQRYKGIWVVCHKSEGKFVVVDYDTPKNDPSNFKMGVIPFKEIIINLDEDETIQEFKQKLDAIVGDRPYVLSKTTYEVLSTLPTVVDFLKRCKDKNLTPEEGLRQSGMCSE